jgi:hypothetical protein
MYTNILSRIFDILALDFNPDEEIELKANGYNIYLKANIPETDDILELQRDLTKDLKLWLNQGLIIEYKLSPIGNTLILEIKWQNSKS